VVVATVDAVRNRDGSSEPAATTTTELAGRDALTEQAAALGLRGRLLLRDDGCREQLVSFPSLERTQDPSGCAPRGTESPNGSLVARCLGDVTESFYTSDGGLQNIVPGCAPAWRPDGVLSVAHEREVVRFRPCPGGAACAEPLIRASELERAARRHPTGARRRFPRVLVDGIAWLSETRAAVLLSIRIGSRLDGLGALSQIAFFERGRLEATQGYFRRTGGSFAGSPRGTYVTQTPDVVLRGDGSQVSLPPHLRDVRSFAWLDDERFLALATRLAVHVLDVRSLERFDETGGGLRSVTLPLRATDLSWRN
jgi:hypothetical protein